MAAGQNLLSICVPTYNRAQYLKESLASILQSARGHEDRIELIVSDNASTDNTAQLVAALGEAHPMVRYHRNPENYGAEANLYILASLASGEYIWFFSDDDCMLPQAVPAVLEQARRGCDLMIADFAVWSRDLTRLIRPAYYSLGTDKFFSNPNQVMACFGASLGFISGVVMSRARFLKTSWEEFRQFAPYGFSFLYSVYAGIAGGCRAAYLSVPLLRYRGEVPMEPEQWDKYFITGTALVLEACEAIGYSHAAVLAAKHQVLMRYVVPCVVARKVSRQALHRTYSRLAASYWQTWSFWALCLPLLVAPRPAVSAARTVLNVLRARRPWHGAKLAA